MKIFHYNAETGVFLGEGLADESPLEPGVWLIPASATSVDVPVVPDGHQAIFADGTWEVQPVPEPEPEPEPQPVLPSEPPPVLTTEQKLEAAGLTVAELKELFGLE